MKKDELISRKGLVDKICDTLPFNHMDWPEELRVNQCIGIANNMPAIDAVPVVRCRDCVRRQVIKNGSHVCPYYTVDVPLDGFCHRGKRKDDENGCK